MSTYKRNLGFSLIEMLVAMVVLALSLGVLYQSAAGATRNVRIDERYVYAVQIAQSLLAEHPWLPPEGINLSGLASDFEWRLQSSYYGGVSPAQAAWQGEAMSSIDLMQLDALIRWSGTDGREVKLSTIVPVRIPGQEPEPFDAF